MSLQVWLPMNNGSLKQQGISNESATINGTVVLTDSGKIGKCATFGMAGGGNISLPASTMTSFSECSVAFWLRINNWNTNYCTFFKAGKTSYSWKDYIFGVLRDNNTSHLCFTLTNSSNNSTTNDYRTSLELNTSQWYHLAFTYKAGKAKIYIDGELDSEYSTSCVPNFAGITDIRIGSATGNYNYQTKSNINDVKIFSHCLSQKEISELKKALVLHYSLDGNNGTLVNENLAKGTDKATSNPNYRYNLSYVIPSGTEVTISCWIDADDIVLTDSKRIGLSVGLVKTDGSGSQWFETWKRYNNGLSDHCSYHGRISNTAIIQGDMGLIGAYIQNLSSGTVSISQVKVEIGDKVTPWCPNPSDALYTALGYDDGIEYDTSGYGNNGIKNNSPTYSIDSPRYLASTHLDGVNQTIQLPNLLTLIPDSIFTFNIWFKRLESELGSKAWETIFGGPSGFELETCSANNVHDNKIKAYSWGNGSFEFEFDKWNMLTMVSNGTNTLFYLNGELKLTGTYKSLVSGTYFIGSWKNTSTQNYKGYVSDAKIFATALSDTEIQKLYTVSASIDSNGNAYSNAFVE